MRRWSIVGSSVNRAFFVLMARPDIASVKDLKGKTLGVSQIGDPPVQLRHRAT